LSVSLITRLFVTAVTLEWKMESENGSVPDFHHSTFRDGSHRGAAGTADSLQNLRARNATRKASAARRIMKPKT